MFFDDHRRFLESSDTASDLARLNLRHEAIIVDNADILRGARVLDIASHDGRWTFAALKCGATHITSVEGRQHLVEHTRRNLAAEGIDPSAYELRQSDIFRELASGGIRVNVVLCLGFLYHTLRYNELLHGMWLTGAKYIILDTTVILGTKPMIKVIQDKNKIEANAVPDDYSVGSRNLVGIPSTAALRPMFDAYGYGFDRQYDWPALLARQPKTTAAADYAASRRVTIRWKRRAALPGIGQRRPGRNS